MRKKLWEDKDFFSRDILLVDPRRVLSPADSGERHLVNSLCAASISQRNIGAQALRQLSACRLAVRLQASVHALQEGVPLSLHSRNKPQVTHSIWSKHIKTHLRHFFHHYITQFIFRYQNERNARFKEDEASKSRFVSLSYLRFIKYFMTTCVQIDQVLQFGPHILHQTLLTHLVLFYTHYFITLYCLHKVI